MSLEQERVGRFGRSRGDKGIWGLNIFLVCPLQWSHLKSQDLGFGMTDLLGLRIWSFLELCCPYHKILALILTFISSLASGKKILFLCFQGSLRC